MSTTPKCWMCTYSTDKVVESIHNLVVQNVHLMTVENMAVQCKQVIDSALDQRQAPPEARVGTSVNDIACHIKHHMLHPSVTLAMSLRHLLRLNDRIQCQMCVEEGNGQVVVDSLQVKNYLAVLNQITMIYKMGENNKLLFSRGKETFRDEKSDKD